MSAGEEEEQGGWTVRGTLTAEQTDALEAFRARLFRTTAAEAGEAKSGAGGKEGKHTTTKKKKSKEKAGDEEKAAAKESDEAEADGELTDDQRRWLDDMCLCRYLRARDWDLDKAEVLLPPSRLI